MVNKSPLDYRVLVEHTFYSGVSVAVTFDDTTGAYHAIRMIGGMVSPIFVTHDREHAMTWFSRTVLIGNDVPSHST